MRWLSSVDGMRFYVPVNLLAADYSPILQGMGVTLLAHTSDSYLRPFQQPIPCRLREATFNLDGLVEHDTELHPKTNCTHLAAWRYYTTRWWLGTSAKSLG